MASKLEFVQYVVDQLQGAGAITYRKMFGEYGIYCDGKFFATICDDQLFFKITEGGRKFWPELSEGTPYEGAKPHFLIEELDDRERLVKLTQVTCQELPVPKPKKKKGEAEGKKQKEKSVSSRKLDYKKEFPDLYLPKKKPMLIDVPEMVFLQVEGSGNPNTSAAYADALTLLYGISFGIKMSLKFGKVPGELLEEIDMEKSASFMEGNYVVPPLEGLWWEKDTAFGEKNPVDKDRFCWISMIRQPDEVTKELFEWAKKNLKEKKPELDVSTVKLVRYKEGKCAQLLHVGPYDAEPASIEVLEAFIAEAGYEEDFCMGSLDLSTGRYHHEIYLGDPRKTAPERLKTVIRHPVKERKR